KRAPGLLLARQGERTTTRPPAGHHDAPVAAVGRQLGRRKLQRATHRVDDLLERLLHGLADLARVYPHDLGNAGHEVAALHFHLAFLADRGRGPDLDLDLLRGGLADEQVVVLAHELHNRLIELVPTRPNRDVGDDAGPRAAGDRG